MQVFSCVIAVLVLKAKITLVQWLGVLLIVGGVLITAVPQPIAVPPSGSFWAGLICSVVGSLSLAASYPFSELVFTKGALEDEGSISEEMACCVGSLFNAVLYCGLQYKRRFVSECSIENAEIMENCP